jgi:Clp amino terminal domain, pathogenicity island component
MAGMELAAARAALARLAGRGVVPAPRPGDAEQTFGVQAVGEAQALGHNEVRPEHLLLGVLEAARQPADTVRVSRRHRQILAHLGLGERYRGAMALLVADLAVEPGGVQR